jgi:hypothetical protein
LDTRRSNKQLAIEEVLVALLVPISSMMLCGRVGINQFVSAAKHAYVKAAISDVLPLGSRVNVSRLSVTTGLTRKEVAQIVNAVDGVSPQLKTTKEQRAMRVLRGWCADPRFQLRNGQPAELPLRGGKRAFAQLVKLYGGDVTPLAVLRELERMNAVASTKEGLVRLRSSARRSPLQITQQMLEVATLLRDFTRAIAPTRSNDCPPAFFGYRECDSVSADDGSLFNRTFSRRATALLDGFDQWEVSRRNGSPTGRNTGRVGIGVYLINETTPHGGDDGLSKSRQRRAARKSRYRAA